MRDPGFHAFRGVVDLEDFHDQMRADPVRAARLGFCNDHGIPYSVFTGRTWPNPLDPQEPYWLPEDTEDAVAYRMWLNGMCQGCGLHELDWPDELEDRFRAEARMCFGCAELERARDDVPEDKRQSSRMRLVPTEEVIW